MVLSENSFENLEKLFNYLINNNRFILNPELDNFVITIADSAKNRRQIINKKTQFWRARIGHGPKLENNVIKGDLLTSAEMNAPPREKSLDGRANPKGISHLYLAEDQDTAIAETRPYIGASLTLALFELKRDIAIVDIFTDTFSLEEYIKKKKNNAITIAEEEGLLWWGLNMYFSVPNIPDDNCSYIPTQYVAELLKAKGYDGIKYGSAQKRDKYNLVSFDPSLANQKKLENESIAKICYTTSRQEMQERIHS